MFRDLPYFCQSLLRSQSEGDRGWPSSHFKSLSPFLGPRDFLEQVSHFKEVVSEGPSSSKVLRL